MVVTKLLEIETNSNCDIVNITEHVITAVGESNIKDGIVTIFNVGSTAGLTGPVHQTHLSAVPAEIRLDEKPHKA